MDFLKSLFGSKALTYDQLVEKVNADGNIKIANLAEGHYVQKEKFDSVNRELTAAVKKNEELTAKYADYDDLKKQIATVQADSEAKLNEYKLGVAVSTALSAANIVDETSVKANLDMSKVKIGEDGNLEGLSDQLESLKTDKPFLFKPDQILNLGGSTSGTSLSKDDMSDVRAAMGLHNAN